MLADRCFPRGIQPEKLKAYEVRKTSEHALVRFYEKFDKALKCLTAAFSLTLLPRPHELRVVQLLVN